MDFRIDYAISDWVVLEETITTIPVRRTHSPPNQSSQPSTHFRYVGLRSASNLLSLIFLQAMNNNGWPFQ